MAGHTLSSQVRGSHTSHLRFFLSTSLLWRSTWICLDEFLQERDHHNDDFPLTSNTTVFLDNLPIDITETAEGDAVELISADDILFSEAFQDEPLKTEPTAGKKTKKKSKSHSPPPSTQRSQRYPSTAGVAARTKTATVRNTLPSTNIESSSSSKTTTTTRRRRSHSSEHYRHHCKGKNSSIQ